MTPTVLPERNTRGRTIASVVCLVLAALLTLPAAVAYWGQRTVNDTERYVSTVGPLVDSPEVQDVIATRITDAVQQQVDVESLLDQAFSGVAADRPRVELLVGPISAAVNGFIEREVRAFIASDAFSDFWVAANTRAQQALLRILQGDNSGAVSLQNDQVVLDVDDAITRVQERLADRGLTMVANAPVPETDRQIVLMDAPQVKQLRTAYAFGNPVAKWLLPLVGLLYLAAFVLARRRARMTVWIGALIATNALVLAVALSIGQQLFVNQLAGTPFGPASRVFFQTLLAYLTQGKDVILRLGLVLVLAGLFAGATRFGTGLRHAVGGGLESAGSHAPQGPVTTAGTWVAANVAWLRAVAVAIGAVAMVWGNELTVSKFWWSVALVVVLLVVLQALVGAARTKPAPEPQPAVV